MRQEILEIPRALRMMWAKGRPQYDALVRHASWSERPVFIVGGGLSCWAALTGAYAFESLLGLPVAVRTPGVFSAYTISTLNFRSLLIAVSPSGECEKTLEAVQRAKDRGAIVWGVTVNPVSTLGKLADGIAQVYLHEASTDGIQSAFCQHAAMLFLALAVARALKRRAPLLEAQEAELEKLPENIERVQNQFTDAGQALARELRSLPRIVLIGGGLYHPVALLVAHHLKVLAGLPVAGHELLHFRDVLFPLLQSDTGILMISSSRSHLKAEVYQTARDAGKKVGDRLFAITDSNDHQLSGNAALSVLLPTLTEPVGALLALSFLDCVTHYAAGNSAGSSGRGRHTTNP